MRKFLIILGIVVVLVTAALVVLFLNLDRLVNRNKDFLLSKAQAALGRNVSVGEISVTLRGGIGVRLQDFSLSDDPAYSDAPFIVATDLQVNVMLLPLLRKQFEVKRVILHDPIIRVIRGEDGNFNFSTIMKGSESQARDGSDAAAPLAISLINIDGGEIDFVDRVAGTQFRVTRIESHVEDLDFDKPISIKMAAAVFADEQNVEITATAGPFGKAIDVSTVSNRIELTLDPIDPGAILTALPDLRASMPPGVTIEGPLKLHFRAEGTLANMAGSFRIDATAAAVNAPNLQKPAGTPLVIESKARLSGDEVELTETHLQLQSMSATGSGKFGMAQPQAVRLALAARGVRLAELAAIAPAAAELQPGGEIDIDIELSRTGTDKPAVTGTIAVRDATFKLAQFPNPVTGLQSTVHLAGDRATIEGVSLQIGASRLAGSAQVENFEPLTVSYQATSPSLALDDIRPPDPKRKIKKPEILDDVTAEGRWIGEQTPKNSGTFSSTSGSIVDIDYENLSGRYTITGNKIKLDDVKTNTMEGTVTGSGLVTVDEKSPSFWFDSKAVGVDVVYLFDALPAVTKNYIKGRTNLELSISGRGKEWSQTSPTLEGNGQADFSDGELVDINIFNRIVAELASTTGAQWISQGLKEKYPRVFMERGTRFENLSSTFVVENGKLLARNLKLDAGDYAMSATGGLDFNTGLELNVTLLVSTGLSRDLIAEVDYARYLANSQGRIEVPFRLTGVLPKVRVKADSQFINKVIQRAFAGQAKSKLRGSDIIEKGLKSLFGNKKRKKAPADSTSGG